MKHYVFLTALLTVAGLLSCNSKSVNTSDSTENKYLVGAYADYRELDETDRQLFENTVPNAAALVPQSVATQVVAGMNYSFICTDATENEVKVVIFQPLPNRGEPVVSTVEPITAYDEIIDYIQKGFENEWKTMSPDSMGLSMVYAYRSPKLGFAKKDINGDGVVELLIGDYFEENGESVIYDVFTYDLENAAIKHLLSGGERDRFTINGSGIICEEGANSASDSFTHFYELKNGEISRVETAEDDRMTLTLTPFSAE